jgi:putative polyhydroxyalkanoate system protein
MASLVFERQHALGLDVARAVADRLAQEMRNDYGVDSRWDGNDLVFSRVGLSGVLRINPDSVRLDAQLGFLFSAYKNKIEASMAGNFARYFGA